MKQFGYKKTGKSLLQKWQNMKPRYLIYLLPVGIGLLWSCVGMAAVSAMPPQKEQTTVKQPKPEKLPEPINLPKPRYDSKVSVEQTLLHRRSVRSYTGQPLTLQEVSQLLWAAQGITSPEGFRTAPSAGALYPLEVYVVVGDVVGLAAGVYLYEPVGHKLFKTLDGDKRAQLAEAALRQRWVREGAISLVFTAVYERTTWKYRERGIQYVHIEVGHAAQNVHLQAVALGLGSVPIGAYYDDQVAKLLALPPEERPVYIIPVGRVGKK